LGPDRILDRHHVAAGREHNVVELIARQGFVRPIVVKQAVRPKTLPPASSASDRRLLVQRAVRWPGHCGIDGAMREAAFDDLVAWVENGTVPAGDDVLGDVRQLGLRWTLLRHPKDLQQ
jgi:hypothetical protein